MYVYMVYTILIGVMGTTYKCHSEPPLSKLGLGVM